MDKAGLETMLAGVARNDASSLHLLAGHAPFSRLRGKVVRHGDEPLSDADLRCLVAEFVFKDQIDRLDAGEEITLLYNSGLGVRFRTTLLATADGLSVVLRRLPSGVPTFEQLALPGHVAGFVNFRSGLILMSGFMGSGKTTTLAALVDCVNTTSARHVVCIEDPIEYVHESRTGLVHQREVGSHVSSFARGISDAVKLSAEVIAVSELRGRETLLAMLAAAERGCLVMATMNASSVSGSLEEIESMFAADEAERIMERFAAVLRVTMSQALLERRHNKGRVPLVEILINNQSIANLIAERKFPELPKAMERGRGLGMQTVDIGLKSLLARNLISVEEALYHAVDREAVNAR